MKKCGIIFSVVDFLSRPRILMAGLLASALLFCVENSLPASHIDDAVCCELPSEPSDADDPVISGETQPVQKEMAFAFFRPVSFCQSWGVGFPGRQQQSKTSQWFSPLHPIIHDCFHSPHFKRSFFSNASTHCCIVRPHALFCRYLN